MAKVSKDMLIGQLLQIDAKRNREVIFLFYPLNKMAACQFQIFICVSVAMKLYAAFRCDQLR